jgi:hypothetical protein
LPNGWTDTHSWAVPGVGVGLGVGESVGVGLFVGVVLFVGVGEVLGVGLLVGVAVFVGVGLDVGELLELGPLPLGEGSGSEAEGPDGIGVGSVGAAAELVLPLGAGELGVTERDELGVLIRAAVRTAGLGLWPHFAAGVSAALAGVPAAKIPIKPADSTLVPASAPRPAPRRVIHTISASSCSASRQGFPRHL